MRSRFERIYVVTVLALAATLVQPRLASAQSMHAPSAAQSRQTASAQTVTPAPPEIEAPPQPAPRDLAFNFRSDMIASGTLLVANLVVEFAWSVPTKPRWEAVSEFDLRVAENWGVDSPLRVTRASDGLLGLAMVATPLVTFFGPMLLSRDKAGMRRGAQDAIIVLEATLSAAFITQSVKKIAARTRPAVYFDTAEMTNYSSLLQLRDRQRYVSFFSGHASTATSLAASLITVGYLRRYPYRHALAVAFGALALATGWLRVVGRIHWASDVLAGWGVGALVGVGVPLLHQRLSRHEGETSAHVPSITPSGSAGLHATWSF